MDYPLTFLHVPCHTQVPNKGKKYNSHVVFKTFFKGASTNATGIVFLSVCVPHSHMYNSNPVGNYILWENC